MKKYTKWRVTLELEVPATDGPDARARALDGIKDLVQRNELSGNQLQSDDTGEAAEADWAEYEWGLKIPAVDDESDEVA